MKKKIGDLPALTNDDIHFLNDHPAKQLPPALFSLLLCL